MEDKQYLDEAGLGEVGKVISKFYASKDDIKDLDGLKDFVASHNEIKLHYITQEKYKEMQAKGESLQLSDIHDPISIVGIEQTANTEYEWNDTPLDSLYVMGLNVERLLGGGNQKYLLFNITPNHKITSDRIDNVDFNAIPLKDKDIRIQLAFGERDLCFYWRFLINDDSHSEWHYIQDPYSRQRIDNLIKQMQDKVDKSELPTKLSQLEEDPTHRAVSTKEKANWNNKVDKINGKALSTNDYTDEDKKKLNSIDCAMISSSIKTQDIIDNLESDDSTKPLSAKQGKMLFQYANEGKDKIANALIGKGIKNVSKDSSFADLAKCVNEVKTGYGVGDIIESKNMAEIINKKELKTLFQFNIDKKVNLQNVYVIEKDGLIYSAVSDFLNGGVYKTNLNGENEWVMKNNEFTHDGIITDIHNDTNGNLYLSYAEMDNQFAFNKFVELSPSKEIVSTGYLPYDTKRIIDIDYNNCWYLRTDKTLIKTNSAREKIWEVETKGYTVINSVANNNDMVFALARQQSDGRKSALFIINQKGNIIFEAYSSDTPYDEHISTDNDGNFYYQQKNTIYKITQTGEIVNSVKIEQNISSIVDKFGYIYTINNSKHIIKINQKAETVWELSDLECNRLVLVGDNYIIAVSNNSLTAIQNAKEVKFYKILH